MPVILYNYLYVRGTTTFDEMTYLSASDRMTLKEGFSLNFPTIASSVESFRNGPRRLSLVYPDLVSPINATLIPRVDHFVPDLAAANRKKYKKPSESSDKSGLTEASESPMGTLCLSTHAHDPISGRLVPLSAAQLIAQVVVGLKEAGDLPRPSKKERVPRKITQFAFTVFIVLLCLFVSKISLWE